MVEIIHGWQCVGCGKVDVPSACIGICEDRRLEMVAAEDYYLALQRAERAERECSQLRTLLGHFEGRESAEERYRYAYDAFP